ncbi:hypothetical protein RchiOBHm_Chr4g0403581 [Rosa chinensis]|uniref:Uncharacterized protein n=1 Tax=Rosa chinensis TaxID=74649 RepID=A0A2P6QTL8_ROSCH|nr:hypothetical protein RchiOBHm_Chr4g0403581 [Rosa chinensis]
MLTEVKKLREAVLSKQNGLNLDKLCTQRKQFLVGNLANRITEIYLVQFLGNSFFF